MKKSGEIIETIKKNSKYLLLGAIALIIFRQYTLMIILIVVFYFFGVLTLQVSRMVPHISIESVTASSIFLGYVFDWKVGLGFGLICGIVGYAKISLIKHTTIVNTLFMGLCGVIASLLHSLHYSFGWTFFITFFIRMNVGFFVFRMLNPDLVENIMHSYGDGLWNILIVSNLLNILYVIIKPFVG